MDNHSRFDKELMVTSLSGRRRSWTTFLAAALAAVAFLLIPKIASACSTYGLIGTKWSATSSTMGPCVDDEHDDGSGGRIQKFANGYITWVYPQPSAHIVYGNIASAWMSRYGGAAFLGEAVSDQVEYFDVAYVDLLKNGAHTYLTSSPTCTNSDDVCEVFGSIGQEWHTYLLNQWDAYPVTESFAVAGGGEQFFENGWIITWNASNNHSCTFQYGTLRHGTACLSP